MLIDRGVRLCRDWRIWTVESQANPVLMDRDCVMIGADGPDCAVIVADWTDWTDLRCMVFCSVESGQLLTFSTLKQYHHFL